MARNKKNITRVDSLKHKDKRKNIPTEELRDFVEADEKAPKTMFYPRDPSLDPQLVWKGKDEQDRKDLAVPVVPIYIQEKIQPQAIIEDLLAHAKPAGDRVAEEEAAYQLKMFGDFNKKDRARSLLWHLMNSRILFFAASWRQQGRILTVGLNWNRLYTAILSSIAS